VIEIGVVSNVAPLREVLVKSPRAAWRTRARVEAEWRQLQYTSEPHLEDAASQHNTLVRLLHESGCRVHTLPPDDTTGLDSVYVHDPVVMAAQGAVLCRMGKVARGTEPAAIGGWLEAGGIPILGRIEPPGLLEGGDVVWLSPRTIAVGEGYRSNAPGIQQLAQLLRPQADQVITVPLPHWTGPADCLHLMSLLSPVADQVAVVYSRLLPVPFRSWLIDHGWRLIEVPDEEYMKMACNVLPVAPSDCIMLEGCPITAGRMEAAGVRVRTYPGSEISLKGGGGPTCLTRPLLRQ
jgi:N-dimethylarginine dimethylaminohydrolase